MPWHIVSIVSFVARRFVCVVGTANINTGNNVPKMPLTAELDCTDDPRVMQALRLKSIAS